MVVTDRTQHLEHLKCLRNGCVRGLIEKAKLRRSPHTPCQRLEYERCDIDLQYLGLIVFRSGGVLHLRPQADCDSGAEPAGTACPLLCRRLGMVDRHQLRHAGRRVVARPTGETGVDDAADAIDGERRFGHVGGDNNPAFALDGAQGGILLIRTQRAVERSDRNVHVRLPVQVGGNPLDLPDPGKEDQHVAWCFQSGLHSGDHRLLEFATTTSWRPAATPARRASLTGLPADLDREGAAGTPDDRRRVIGTAHQPGNPISVDRRGHDEDSQILTDLASGFEGQGKAKIGMDAALVKFIEEHNSHTGKRRVTLKPSGQNPLGDHFDPGASADPFVVAGAPTDGLTHGLAQQLRHSAGDSSSRDPARFEHKYYIVGKPGLVEQPQGNDRRFAGTRFGDEDTKTPIGKGVANVGNDVFDRKPGVGRRMSHEHILLARRGNAPHDTVWVVSSCNVLLPMSRSSPMTTADQHVDAVAAHVSHIWPRADGHQLAVRFIDAIGGNAALGNTVLENTVLGDTAGLWTERDVVLITYGDSIIGDDPPLRSLVDLVRSRLGDAFAIVHILPFGPSSSDRGFSVIDYREVDPLIGSWDDIDDLRTDVDVMVDLVANHISAQSVWFGQFLAGESPGKDYFIVVDPASDLSAVVRPRALPLLTEYPTPSGPQHVWTTFSDDQIDLNWANPDLVCEMLAIIDTFLSHGARFLRLDAIAYLWKEIGTNCVHRPQTHELVKLVHTLLAGRAPYVGLLTETNVPDAENRSYFGDGDEADLIYNFTLPPLLIDGLLNGRIDRLAKWLTTCAKPPAGTTMMNFLSSHDGIGVRPAEGFLTDREIAALVDLTYERGGRHGEYNRAGIPMPYELNISLPDLFGGPSDEHMVERILLAHTVVLTLAGVAAVYVNSLLATTNDLAAVEADGVRRSINRGRVHRDHIPARGDGTWQARIFDGITSRAALRREHASFHPDAPQTVASDDHAVLRIVRTARDATERITVLCNFSDETVSVDLDAPGTDLLGRAQLTDATILSPYGAVWVLHD